MPKAPRKTTIKATAYIPPGMYDQLVERSRVYHRSLTSEILSHVERGLQNVAMEKSTDQRSNNIVE